LELCSFVTPNETEVEAITGVSVNNIEDAKKAADRLLGKGVGAAVITLGEKGVLYHDHARSVHVAAYHAGPVVETTGAGDAFNGGFAAALVRGFDPVEAVKFGNATAGISVTRAGTAPSMPSLAEIESLLEQSERS
jgi:ribokinase